MLTPIFLLPFGHSLLGLTDSLLPRRVIPGQRSALPSGLGGSTRVRELLADLFWGPNSIYATAVAVPAAATSPCSSQDIVNNRASTLPRRGPPFIISSPGRLEKVARPVGKTCRWTRSTWTSSSRPASRR